MASVRKANAQVAKLPFPVAGRASLTRRLPTALSARDHRRLWLQSTSGRIARPLLPDFMHKPRNACTLALALTAMLALANTACTQRDFLTRHSAADIISNSDSFRAQQEFWLRTGIISNKDYLSPEYLVLQHRGWITGVNVPCSPDV